MTGSKSSLETSIRRSFPEASAKEAQGERGSTGLPAAVSSSSASSSLSAISGSFLLISPSSLVFVPTRLLQPVEASRSIAMKSIGFFIPYPFLWSIGTERGSIIRSART